MSWSKKMVFRIFFPREYTSFSIKTNRWTFMQTIITNASLCLPLRYSRRSLIPLGQRKGLIIHNKRVCFEDSSFFYFLCYSHPFIQVNQILRIYCAIPCGKNMRNIDLWGVGWYNVNKVYSKVGPKMSKKF